MASRRFKAEFLTLSVSTDPFLRKTYNCCSLLDQQNYSVFKTSFASPELKTQTLKVINRLSQIYHKNVLRYYNVWKQFSTKDTSREQFYFQLEKGPESLFSYISGLRRSLLIVRNHEAFLRKLLDIYLQILEGISELFHYGLRQRNLMDFNDIFINNFEEVKLGELKNLDFIENERELAEKVLSDIEGVTYKLFFEENPFFRAWKRGKNKENCEILRRIEEYFTRGIKGRCREDLIGNMSEFFEELKKFARFMRNYKKEEVLGSFELRFENREDQQRKMVLKLSGKEIRCYRDAKDRKPERIFKFKDFQIRMEKGVVVLKSPIEIGCSIKGSQKDETLEIYQRIIKLLREKSY